MTWFKVDDSLSSHPKARAAGLPAMGLWVVAGSWASQHLTDGYIPEWFVKSWRSGPVLASKLVDSGLWDVADGGWVFHQWAERQPSKARVESERESARKRKQASRESQRDNQEDTSTGHSVTDGGSHASPTRPVLSSFGTNPMDRFDDFWKAYPKKVGKPAATKAWKAALKRKADPDMLVSVAAAFRERVKGKDPQFICHPSTWLNDERYNDEPQITIEPAKTYWTPEAPPREVADNPELYAAWYADEHAKQRGAS